jgi:hypothetical protein
MTKQEIVKKAWSEMSKDAVNRFYKVFGYSRQRLHQLLNDSIKDETSLDTLLLAMKQASKDALKDAEEKNNKIQGI